MGQGEGAWQAREKNREFTACDKCYAEIYESGRVRATQEWGGVSDVRATQGDADGSRNARLRKCRCQGRMRKHNQRVTHCKMWLTKPLQRRLRIMR